MIKLIKDLIKKHPTLYELFKFCVTGGINTLVDMALMALVIYLFNPSLYTNFSSLIVSKHSASTLAVVIGTGAGFLGGVLVSYVLSLFFVFNKADTGFAKSPVGLITFVALSSVGLAVHTAGMYLGYNLLGINEWIIKIFLTVVVLIFNYLTRKFIIFKKREGALAAAEETAQEDAVLNDENKAS